MSIKRAFLVLIAAVLLPGLAIAQDSSATFEVTKDFTDNNVAEVEVTLNCFTGLPLVQSQTISESQGVDFVVVSFTEGELDCSVTESAAAGYEASYFDGEATSATSCQFNDLDSGTEACRITNSPAPVAVKVTKDWVIDGGDNGDYLDATYKLVLHCDDEIVNGYESYGKWKKTLYNSDENGTADTTYTGMVIPDWDGGTSCSVEETVYDSSVESNNFCEFGLKVEINTGDSCTIVNSVFYEGIPTLSQYGMAILALLMLGVGFVGFRRFV